MGVSFDALCFLTDIGSKTFDARVDFKVQDVLNMSEYDEVFLLVLF